MISSAQPNKLKTIFDPELGLENKDVGGRVRSLDEMYNEIREEDATTGMFDQFEKTTSKAKRPTNPRKKKAVPTEGTEDKEKKHDTAVLEFIRSGAAVKNQPYRLKRSMPLAQENASLFNSMNIIIEPRATT